MANKDYIIRPIGTVRSLWTWLAYTVPQNVFLVHHYCCCYYFKLSLIALNVFAIHLNTVENKSQPRLQTYLFYKVEIHRYFL